MKRIIKNGLQPYQVHIIIWALFICFEIPTIGFSFDFFGRPLTYVLHYIVIIASFYLHSDVAMPWALKNRGSAFWKLPLVVLLEIGLYIFLSFEVDWFLTLLKILKITHLTYQYSLLANYRHFNFMVYSTGYYFAMRYIKERQRTTELEKQQLQNIIERQKTEQELVVAQNAFLKAQINPHFLFNTLDFIYHKVMPLSPDTAEAIISLADMMRYAIDSNMMGEYILLGDEIDQTENLLYLHQMRKTNDLGVNMYCDEEVRQLYLIPLILLTLVENIFKHGDLSQPEHKAEVRLYINEGLFHMETENLVAGKRKTGTTHKGLENVHQRLAYAYGKGVSFQYHTNQQEHFIIKITIPLEKMQGPAAALAILKANDKLQLHGAADQY